MEDFNVFTSNHRLTPYDVNPVSIGVDVHEFKLSEWSSYLEQKMLKRMVEFLKKESRRPTHFIMSPQDVYTLRRNDRYSYVKKRFDGFYQYRDMLVISSIDLTEGEVICL